MPYFVYLDTAVASDAASEKDAREEAREVMIDRLRKNEVEFVVEKENE
jgi:predicted nucleic acid-binding protein